MAPVRPFYDSNFLQLTNLIAGAHVKVSQNGAIKLWGIVWFVIVRGVGFVPSSQLPAVIDLNDTVL